MARATMDITFQCPGKICLVKHKAFFPKNAILIEDYYTPSSLPILFWDFFSFLDIDLFVPLSVFWSKKKSRNAGKTTHFDWIYRQMSKLISNHETYTKLIFCERLMWNETGIIHFHTYPNLTLVSRRVSI